MFGILRAVMQKELRQTFRDRRMLAILIVAPIVQTVVLGYAVDLDVDALPTVVCDRDRSGASRSLVESFLAGGTFRRAGEVDDPGLAERWLASGDASVALVVERGLGERWRAGRPAEVQVIIDGGDSQRALVALGASAGFFSMLAAKRIEERRAELERKLGVSASVPRISLEPRIVYNPRLSSPRYMVPGVAAFLLLMVTTLLTAMGIARERELGTLEQILVTPLPPMALLAGKCLPFAFLGLIDIAGLMAIGALLFDVPLRGPLWLVFAGTLVYLLTTLGIGILISTVSRTQQQAMMGALFFMLPALLLSGFATPISNMPGWLQPITYLDPMRYFVEFMRGCLIRGSGPADLWPQLLSLLVFGVAALGVGALRFRKRLA